MKERVLTDDKISSFAIYLKNEEKSKNTIEKYIRAVSYTHLDVYKRQLLQMTTLRWWTFFTEVITRLL